MKYKKLLLLLFVLGTASFLHAQVMVNEFQNNGTGANGGDIIELLVTQDNADLRGLIIKDFSNTIADDLNSGGFQFTQDNLWFGLRAGTIILLKQNGATITTDVTTSCNDYNLEVGLSNTTYFTNITPAGGVFDIESTGDMVMVRSVDLVSPGFSGITSNIHTLRAGPQTAIWASIGAGAKVGSNTALNNGRDVFVSTPSSLITDYNLGTTGASAGGATNTLGLPNNATNTTFINFLRGPLSVTSSAVSPVVFTANWAALTNASTYYLDVSTDPTFATFLFGFNNLNVGLVTTYPIPGLAPATTYYFRVRAKDTGTITPSTSANSCVTSVTTSASSSKTTIANGAWNNPAIWSPAGVPLTTDDAVTINHIVTMPAAVTRASGTTTTINSGASLAIAVAYTNSGNTIVNGTFQLDTGGSVTGNNFVYGATGTLNFNSFTVYAVINTHPYWPTTNSPFNVNVLQGGITMTSANRTVAGTFTTASSVALTTTMLTLTGTCQINTGGSFTNPPTYGNASTLIYNTGGSYTMSNEWTQSSLAAGLGVPQNVTIQNSTALTTFAAIARGMAGNLNINSGGLTLAATLNVGGNWTRVATATFTPSGKIVSFIGASVQTVMVSPTGTETYFSLTKSGTGTLQLTTGTNIIVNGANGFTLSSTNPTSGLDLNGQSLSITGGGNLSMLTGVGNRFITSSIPGGLFVVASATASNTTITGTVPLVTDVNTTIKLYSGFNSGATNLLTVNGILEIETGGFCFGFAPKYGSSSLLRYNSGSNPFSRNVEWSYAGIGTIGVTPGYPNNVQVSNNTVINYPSFTPIGMLAMAGNLTIDSGSALHMNYGNVTTGGPMIVAGNVSNAGTLTLGQTYGDDIKIGGNIVNTGTFNGNDRAVFFTKNGTQTVSSTSALTIPYIVFEPTSGATTVQLLSNLVVSATLTGNAIVYSSASDVFDLNGNSLTIGTTGVANVISGSGTFKGSTTSNLTLLGTGSVGMISFSGNQNVSTFTINRSSAAVACVMGSALTVNTSLALTAGIVDLANTAMTIGASATISGASASNFVIADVLNGSNASLLKNVTAAGSFTYPIGDSAASANGSQYSPVSVTFTGGTYAGYAGFAVDDIKEPNLDAISHYITRYWAMYSSGVTPTSYTVTGTYLPADIVGTETSSTSNQWDGSAWTNGGTAISSNTMIKSGNTTVPVVNHFTAGSRDPEINVQQAGINYLTASTYDFGTFASLTPVSVTFTIQNLGGQTLTLSGATFTGTPNYTYTTAYTNTVAGNSSVTFVVTFNPSANGTFTGSISIPNNDTSGSENPYVINFTGTALACAITTWNGLSWSPSAPTISSAVVINGNYSTTSGSFESCSLTINNGFTLTVKSNTYIVVNNDLSVNTGATLIVEDKGSLVMLNDTGIVTNNGTTQVLRTTSPYEQFDYTYWSSPVNATSILTTFTGWRTDYSFDFVTADFSDTLTINSAGTVTAAVADSFDDYAPWAWQNFTGTMANGKGYAIMAPTNVAFTPTANATVTFSGKVNNGVVSVPVVESANAASTIDDYNLIGNPYPSAISANTFLTTNGAKTSGTLYFWTHVANISASNPGPSGNNFVSDDYAVYNLTGGTSASLTGSTMPSGYIASGQGFFVEAQGNNTLVFNNAMRSKTYSNSDFFKTASTQEPNAMDRLWLNLQNADGMFSQLLLAYSDQTSLDYDWGYDGRVNQSPNYLNFYSMSGSEMYKIQARSSFDLNDVVPVGYFSAVSGDFTIGLGQQDGVLNAPETPIYLEDVMQNIVHDLRQGPYVFTTASGRFENRFRLRYSNTSLTTPSTDSLNSNVVAWTHAGTLLLNSTLELVKDITVYDMLGRQLYTAHDIMNHQWSTTEIAISNQPLLLKITLSNGTIVTRKVLF
jgi:hypothetical protein